MKQYYTTEFMFKNEIPYASIPKQYLKDNNLSIKAKGLLTIIYTLPAEWEYNFKGLQKVANISEKMLRTLLHEIQEEGYIHISKTRNKNGRFKYSYLVFLEKQDFNEWYLQYK